MAKFHVIEGDYQEPGGEQSCKASVAQVIASDISFKHSHEISKQSHITISCLSPA